MFGLSKKEKPFIVCAPMNGVAKRIEDVEDEAFREKLLGDGAAVIPDSGEIFSPVSGVVADITDTKHAFCITTDDGVDVLLHVGINTVNLKGEGFRVFVKPGDRVVAGDKLAEVELSLLKTHNMPFDTPVVLTESEKYEVIKVASGELRGGCDTLFTYRKR